MKVYFKNHKVLTLDDTYKAKIANNTLICIVRGENTTRPMYKFPLSKVLTWTDGEE